MVSALRKPYITYQLKISARFPYTCCFSFAEIEFFHPVLCTKIIDFIITVARFYASKGVVTIGYFFVLVIKVFDSRLKLECIF